MHQVCRHFISAVPLLSDVMLTLPEALEGGASNWKGLACAIALLGALDREKRIPTRTCQQPKKKKNSNKSPRANKKKPKDII